MCCGPIFSSNYSECYCKHSSTTGAVTNIPLQRALQILLQPVPQSKIPLAETVFHPTMLSIKNLPHARFFIFYNAQDNSSQ